jgi:hypothetical protein
MEVSHVSRPATPIAGRRRARPRGLLRPADCRDRGRDGAPGPRDGDGLRGRAGGRRDAWARCRRWRATSAAARGLRPPRHPADPRRGDVRHGPDGHALCLHAGWVVPDILCIAKGLGAGYQPIGAMLCTEEIHDAIRRGQRASFSTGTPTWATRWPVRRRAGGAGPAGERRCADRVAPMGETARRAGATLRPASARRRHPRARAVPGLELVADRETKAPLDPEMQGAARLKAAAFARPG